MKKNLIALAVALSAAGAGTYRLVSNKAHHDAEIAAQAKRSVAVPVTVLVAHKDTLSRFASIEGTIVARREVTVLSETGGRVLATSIEPGSKVDAGSPLARLDARITAGQLAAARAALSNAQQDLQRMENLQKGGASTLQGVEQARLGLENARANLLALEKQQADAVVRSPIRGQVTVRLAQVGSVLGAGSPVATVSDMSSLALRVALTADEVQSLRTGMTVPVRIGEADMDAKVETISPAADQGGRYQADLKLPSGRFLLGQPGAARLRSTTTMEQIVLPRAALVAGIKDPKVFVAEGGKARLRKLTLGLTADDRIAVASGLKIGEQVIVTGTSNLVEAAEITVLR